VDWVESRSGLFWITGKPGAGKSTLMKYISNSEQTSVLLQKQGDNVKEFSFCFFELGEPHEKVFLGFLHSILYQLVRSFPRLVYVILSIYREIQRRNTEHDPHKLEWNQDDTRRALKAISKQSSVYGQVCMFIDGLDECDG
jgi:ABC-type molybdenum transport system ATPase subunit/photorepair protein PhrA